MAKAFAKFPGQKTNLFQRACWVWRELPVPVIAVVHGHCFGGGLQLALAADFRFTTPDCTFSVMEAKWGLIPDMTGTVTMRELAAMDVVKRLAMTAELFDGNQALEWGFVSGVSDNPIKPAQELLSQIAVRSPDAVAATKTLLHKTWNRSPRGAFWIESRIQLALMRGKKLLIVQPLDRHGKDKGKPLVAVDSVGAGAGETIYWCRGREASFPFLPNDVPTEATIVGIVDSIHIPSSSAPPGKSS